MRSLIHPPRPARLLFNEPGWLNTLAAWLLALLWVLPLAYAVWTAFHPAEYATRFALDAPLTLDNFRRAWTAAPFARYFFNTTLLVAMILAAQLLLLAALAAYAFARYRFRGRNLVFALVLVQLMVMPDILVVENYQTMARLPTWWTPCGPLACRTLPRRLPYFCCAKPS